MSEPIRIINQTEDEGGWVFKVSVGEPRSLEYAVTVHKKDYKQLTNEAVSPETLVKRSFEFLLEREPKEAILRSFDINLISHYFPEYKSEIGKRL